MVHRKNASATIIYNLAPYLHIVDLFNLIPFSSLHNFRAIWE